MLGSVENSTTIRWGPVTRDEDEDGEGSNVWDKRQENLFKSLSQPCNKSIISAKPTAVWRMMMIGHCECEY